MDKDVGTLADAVQKSDDANADLKATAKLALTPVEHRGTIMKVSGALNTLAEKQPKPTKLPETDPETDPEGGSGGDKPAGSSTGMIVGIIAAVVALGGGVYCRQKSMLCFKEGSFCAKCAPKTEANEGGEKDLYKSEVKSKNSHKRHAKESLMPTFKVADEQA